MKLEYNRLITASNQHVFCASDDFPVSVFIDKSNIAADIRYCHYWR